jgi:hypothetical protein
MTHNAKIAHVVGAAILTMCATGSAVARDSVAALRTDLTAVQESVAELNSQVQAIQFNQDHNIVRLAAYVANGEFNSYIISLTRLSDGCRVFVGDERVTSAVTPPNTADILMDPGEIMNLAGVDEFFNQPAMIPLHVECVGDEGIEKGNVTGMLFRPAALPTFD